MNKLFKNMLYTILFLLVISSCGNVLSFSDSDSSGQIGQTSVSRVTATDDSWIKSSSIYQVYVKAFRDSDGSGIGDLKGVIEKLPYLKSIGVETLWLMPVFEADSYHGYNTNNYYQIRSEYGSNQDLTDLVTEVHNNDMKLILDLVVNHTGYNVSYFNDSSKTDWYCWENSNLNYNNDSTWSDINSWETPWGGDGVKYWDVKLNRGNYYAVFGQDMPDLNYRNPEVVAEVKNIMRYWVETADVDGFRCDAARYLVEEGKGVQKDLDATHALWKEFRAALQNVKPSAILLAEAPTETADQLVEYYGNGDEFNTAFHFGLQYKLVAAYRDGYRQGGLLEDLYAVQGRIPSNSIDTIFLSNHDSFAGQRVGYQMNMDLGKMKGAASLYILLSGIPSVYYAEELGYNNVNGEATGDDSLRGNINWNDVDVENNDPNSMLNHYRGLFNIRNSYDALKSGISMFASSYDGSWDYYNQDSDTMAIFREYYGEKILVVHNFSSSNREISVDLESSGLTFTAGEEAYILMGTNAGNQGATITDANKSFYSLGSVPGLTTAVIFFGNIDNYRDSNGVFPIYGTHSSTTGWDSLYLRGTFNSWSAQSMSKDGDIWSTEATFAEGGRYKFDRYADWSINYGASSTDGVATQTGNDIYIPSAGTWTITLNEKTLEYTMSNEPVETYTVSGLIQEDGVGLSGVEVTIGTKTATTDTSGSYSISGVADGTYTLNVFKSGYTFDPSSISVSVTGADVVLATIVATPVVITDLKIHFQEWESATTYSIHPWDGLSGDIEMSYEGEYNGSHWWVATISNAPDHFMFCFTNSNNNWDGGNRSYDSQANEIYIRSWDNSVYTSR